MSPSIVDLKGEDHSTPARKRNPAAPAFQDRERRGYTTLNVTPAPDWTGHRFKAPADLGPVDYSHVGRVSTAKR